MLDTHAVTKEPSVVPRQEPGLRFRRKLEAIVYQANRWHRIIDEKEWSGLSKLLQEFSSFSGDYIRLLEKTPEPIFRRPFVLNTGIERLLQEWSILSRACEQRFKSAEDASGETVFQRNLREATELVTNYCSRWHPEEPANGSYLKLKTPVVYFEKLYRISRAIYAPEIPVVSIPLTDFIFPTEQSDGLRWQALAHELGHHIYWNGVALKESGEVHERLHAVMAEALSDSTAAFDSEVPGWARRLGRWADRVRLWEPWLEEVFADICGTLLAGPAYAVSAQDVEADRINRTADLAKGDYQHPCAYLRPFISLEVLREIAGHSSATEPVRNALTVKQGGLLQGLERRWRNSCSKASRLPHTETGFTMKELERDIPYIVKAILGRPVWPYSKTLWDLIEFYGREPRDVEALKQPIELTSLSQVSDGRPQGIMEDPPADIGDSPSFKRLWQDLEARVDEAKLRRRQKPLFFWSLLLGMDLSETRRYPIHECTADHWHFPHCGWWREHRHPQDGSTVICC